MDVPKNSTIISKRMNRRYTRRRKIFSSITERYQKDELYRNSQLAISCIEEHSEHLDSLMATDFSYTATRKERQQYENNRRQWSRAETWTNEEKGRSPTSSKTNFWFRENKWRIQIRISLNNYDSDSDQLKNVKGWNSNGNVGDGTIGLKLLPPLQPDWVRLLGYCG